MGDGRTAKLGGAAYVQGARRGCLEEGASLRRTEESGGGSQGWGLLPLSRSGGGGCVLRGWEWDWADALHSACAFPGVSFLFFLEEMSREGAMPGRGAGLPHLGAAPGAGRWGRRGAQPPTVLPLGWWRPQRC